MYINEYVVSTIHAGKGDKAFSSALVRMLHDLLTAVIAGPTISQLNRGKRLSYLKKLIFDTH